MLAACGGGNLREGYAEQANAYLAAHDSGVSSRAHVNNAALVHLWKDKEEYIPLITSGHAVRGIRLISGSEPQYPLTVSVREKSRTVRVSFVVSPSGLVEEARVLESDDHRLDPFAIEAMLLFKFSPAQGTSGAERAMATMPFVFGPRRSSGNH
jgi:TonB family protein